MKDISEAIIKRDVMATKKPEAKKTPAKRSDRMSSVPKEMKDAIIANRQKITDRVKLIQAMNEEEK